MSKYKVGVWGQFGSGGRIADGQAVRTTIITEEIIKKYGSSQVKILNTNSWSRNPFAFLLKSFFLVFKCKKIIIFPADNGFKTFVPLLDKINMFFKRELLYVVIGGFLPQLLREKRKYLKYLHKYSYIFVQTPKIGDEISNLGLKNIKILSNLKNLDRLEVVDVHINKNKKITVCTFSRITYSKGIEDAINGVKIANGILNDQLITLDVYGVIDSNYNDSFNKLLLENSSFVTYKGVIDYNQTVSFLKQYFALLFPTFYKGEGFAGNIIDAFYSGLPIIATDWLFNSEIIREKENGILVPTKSPEKIAEALVVLYNDRALTHKIALNNLDESLKYTPEIVLKDFFECLKM